jgi:hypothetical protein
MFHMCGTYMLGLAAPPVPDGRPSRNAAPKLVAFECTKGFNPESEAAVLGFVLLPLPIACLWQDMQMV